MAKDDKDSTRAMYPMAGTGAAGGAEAVSQTRLRRSARVEQQSQGRALASVWVRG